VTALNRPGESVGKILSSLGVLAAAGLLALFGHAML
jgi:hypothetical protein